MTRGKMTLMPLSIENHLADNGQMSYFIISTSNGIDRIKTWAPEDLLKIEYSEMIEEYWTNSRKLSHTATNTMDLPPKPSPSTLVSTGTRVVYKVVNPPIVQNGKLSHGAIPAQILNYDRENQIFKVKFADDTNLYDVGREEMIASNPRMVCKFFLHEVQI